MDCKHFIDLTENEMIAVKHFGLLRRHSNLNGKIPNTAFDRTRDVGDLDMDGAIGEYAFSKWKNCFMSLCTANRIGSYDFKINNTRIDIKTTRFASSHIVSKLEANPDIDIYVLAVLDKSRVYFPGWIRKSELVQEQNIKDLGRGLCYAVPCHKLKPWPEES